MLVASSLGQRQENDDRREERAFVVESEQKVLRLSDHVVMAFAGRVGPATAFARALRDALRTEASLKAAIKAVGTATYAGDTDFVAVLATNESGGPELLVLDSTTWQLETPPRNEILVFGTARSKPHFFDQTSSLIAQMSTEEPVTRLVWALVELNTLALQEDLVSVFVGGVFIGALVLPSEVVWQPALYYQPYLPRSPGTAVKDPAHRVAVQILDDLAVVRSTMSADEMAVTKLLRCCLVDDQWMVRNSAAVAIRSWSADFYALLPIASSDRRLVLSSSSSWEIGFALFGEFQQKVAIRDDIAQFMGPATSEVPLWLPLPHAVSFSDPRKAGETTLVE